MTKDMVACMYCKAFAQKHNQLYAVVSFSQHITAVTGNKAYKREASVAQGDICETVNTSIMQMLHCLVLRTPTTLQAGRPE